MNEKWKINPDTKLFNIIHYNKYEVGGTKCKINHTSYLQPRTSHILFINLLTKIKNRILIFALL